MKRFRELIPWFLLAAVLLAPLGYAARSLMATFPNGVWVGVSSGSSKDSPDVTPGKNDIYVKGTSEFDGAARFDAGVTLGDAAADEVTLTGHLDTLRVGTGSTPDVTPGDDDAFIEGTLEVDGASRFDGALDINSNATFAASSVVTMPRGL